MQMPKFSDYIGAEKEQEQDAVASATEGGFQPSEEVQAEPTGGDAPEVAAEREAPSEPEPVSNPLVARFRKRGFDMADDVDPEDLYDQVIDHIAAGMQARQELELLRSELEKTQSPTNPPTAPIAASPTPTPQAVQESPAEKGNRLFRELKRYDDTLLNYVKQDESGRYVPRTQEFGQLAIDAAQQVNAYHDSERAQAQLLLSNPHAIFQDSREEIEKLAEEKARAIVAEQLKAFQDQQAKAAEEQTAHQRQAEYENRVNSWHNTNKAKLLKLDANGEPMRHPFNPSQYAFTQMGNTFMEKLTQLRERFQGVDDMLLMDQALEYASLVHPEQPKTAAPVTPAEQRKRFIEGAKKASPPNTSVQPAPVEEVAASTPRMRFADMVLADPENQEIVSGW